MPDEIHVGDPTHFVCTIADGEAPVDLSSATLVAYFKAPDGDIISRAGVVADADEGTFTVDMTSEDFDVPGPWRAQIFLTIAGQTWHSSKSAFVVHDNLA